jgi:hypothetical protein
VHFSVQSFIDIFMNKVFFFIFPDSREIRAASMAPVLFQGRKCRSVGEVTGCLLLGALSAENTTKK